MKIGYDETKPAGTQDVSHSIDSTLQEETDNKSGRDSAVNDETQSNENNTVPLGTPTEQPAEAVQPAPPAPTAPATELINYDNQIKLLKNEQAKYAQANETEEERKKREKREKSKRIIAAIGDGISALSNLYFTSQYAPNMYNPNYSQLAQVDARQEKLKAEREADKNRYLNYSLRVGNLENERAKTVRELEAQAERLRLARERAKREQEKHKWLSDLQPDKIREQASKAAAAANIAKIKEAEAENAEALQQAKVETELQRGKTEQAKQKNSNASAAAHNRSNVSEFSAYDERGREHKFRTKAAADAYAKQHGTFKEEDKTDKTTTTDRRGRTTTSKKVSSGSGYPQKPKNKYSSFSIHEKNN